MSKSVSVSPERQNALYQEFTRLIEKFEQGLMSGRGLAMHAEEMTSLDELEQIADELLLHTFWAVRHVMQRPACWAPAPEEVSYLLRCLKKEDAFSQEVADHYRQ